jgi:hypothetical protein
MRADLWGRGVLQGALLIGVDGYWMAHFGVDSQVSWGMVLVRVIRLVWVMEG